MASFGFELGVLFFEKSQAWGSSPTWDIWRLRANPRLLQSILVFYAQVGGWPRMWDPVADFWVGYQSCRPIAPPRRPSARGVQLPLF
jgi:hypothetical protein